MHIAMAMHMRCIIISLRQKVNMKAASFLWNGLIIVLQPLFVNERAYFHTGS